MQRSKKRQKSRFFDIEKKNVFKNVKEGNM